MLYGKKDESNIFRGKCHEYLVVSLYYQKKGKVIIEIIKYLNDT